MDDWAKQRLAALHARAPQKRAKSKKRFAHIPLPWGYRVFAVAGSGAPIVIYALHVQMSNNCTDVPITASVLKEECGGLDRKTRNQTIDRLVKAGFATVRRRGKKFCGCPLLTMLYPKP